MMVFSFFISAFFVSQLWSTPLSITVQDPRFNSYRHTDVDMDKADIDIAQLHKRQLVSRQSMSTRHHRELTFEVRKTTIAGQIITRSTPKFDGIPVLGADGIFNGNDHHKQFNYSQFEVPHASFKLSAAEAMEKAIVHNPESLIKDPYVEKTEGLYEPIWIMHFGELRPAFQVRLPTLSIFDLKDIYVDAENGDVLLIEDTAQFITAPSSLFVYSPTSSELDQAELRTVSLKNLVGIKEDGFLRGEYINVRTCCKYFTCPEVGECNENTKRCALQSHANAQQTREILSLPTDSLGLDPLISMPDNIYVDTVRCTFLPFARASYKDGQKSVLGFFDKPIDQPGIESEMDRFSEIQAYFSVMSFFNNVRSLLNDNTWCLRPEAMSCNSDGSPVLDDDGNPRNPYRVFVNQLIPDMKMDPGNQSDPENFLFQVMGGKGSRENPIKLNKFIRVGNAAFVPSLYTLKKSTARADEMLSDLIKPYDHNVFFQGERDFAYDGDVVFHEFSHAITTSLINKINSLGLDEWGIHTEPGSLNEAWADYFAAAFTEDPKIGEYASIKGGYGEVALRDIENKASCPEDVIGEIHNDGLIWSGALWEIRAHLNSKLGAAAAKEFDRAVLASLAEAKTTEDFKTQSEKVVNNVRIRQGLGDEVARFAKSVFDKRGITDCFRAYNLATVDSENNVRTRQKNMMFVPSKNQIGLKNYAPSTLQLEIGIPAGAKNVKLSWKQFLGTTGALLGTEARPDSTKNIIPLGLLAQLVTPISWKFKNSMSIAKKTSEQASEPINTQPIDAEFKDGYWQATIPVELARCEQKTMYVSVLSKDHKYVLNDIKVNFDIDRSEDLSDCTYFSGTIRREHEKMLQNCATTNGSGMFLIAALTLFLMLKMHARYRR